jgi:hypothetical protein
MARAALTVQTPTSSGLNPTYTAAIADGHAFDNANGDVILHVMNASAGSITVTIDVNKSTDGLAIPDKTITIPAGENRFIGPFKESLYNQDSTTPDIDEAVLVNTSAQASVSYAALKVVASH